MALFSRKPARVARRVTTGSPRKRFVEPQGKHSLSFRQLFGLPVRPEVPQRTASGMPWFTMPGGKHLRRPVGKYFGLGSFNR